MATAVFEQYLRRFFIHPVSGLAALPEAELYVVIPSYKEPGLLTTLQSVACAVPPSCTTHIVIVLNDRGDEAEVEFHRRQNEDLSHFIWPTPKITHTTLWASGLSGKNAGVGLARKIGMDAVIAACAKTGKNAALVCLDSDCLVAPDYFQALEKHFVHTNAEVGLLEFLHQPTTDKVLQEGIHQYELFLEYYRLGLFRAGYPFHFHTVGSSMACKAAAYARSGGMNQRQAGEDFYFLHKLFPFYKTVEIPGPLVFPSPRISDRVPFGTGRFQQGWTHAGNTSYRTYHPEVFSLLKTFLEEAFLGLKDEGDVRFIQFASLHPQSIHYLEANAVLKQMARIQKSSPHYLQREKSFFQWFDGLMALRFVHFFREFFVDQPVVESLTKWIPQPAKEADAVQKVMAVRKLLTSPAC